MRKFTWNRFSNPAQVTSKHNPFVFLAQNGQILFIHLYWTNWQV